MPWPFQKSQAVRITVLEERVDELEQRVAALEGAEDDKIDEIAYGVAQLLVGQQRAYADLAARLGRIEKLLTPRKVGSMTLHVGIPTQEV